MRRSIAAISTIWSIALTAACGRHGATTSRALPEPNMGATVREYCAPEGDADRFFPPKTFKSWDDAYADAPRIYYGLFLTAMGEPSLWCGGGVDESYRLIRLERNGVPLSVRVERRGASMRLSWVKLEAPTWVLPPNSVMARGNRQISDVELELIRTAYAAADVWRLPIADPAAETTSTDWLLEARVGSNYRGVVRHPAPSPYRAAGLVLMELAGIDEAELSSSAPGVTFHPHWPQSIPGLPPAPEPPPPPAGGADGARR